LISALFASPAQLKPTIFALVRGQSTITGHYHNIVLHFIGGSLASVAFVFHLLFFVFYTQPLECGPCGQLLEVARWKQTSGLS
jgi:hypothetical protein